MSSKKNQGNLIAQNKKARHYYELLEFVEAGIVLTGPEVKSIRQGGVSFKDSYITFRHGEAYVVGLHIAPYANGGYALQDPDRERKLLLHHREIVHLAKQIEQKGLTIVPVNMHFKDGRIKVDVAVGKGKKLHDHRDSLKQAAEQRDAEREMKFRS